MLGCSQKMINEIAAVVYIFAKIQLFSWVGGLRDYFPGNISKDPNVGSVIIELITVMLQTPFLSAGIIYKIHVVLCLPVTIFKLGP